MNITPLIVPNEGLHDSYFAYNTVRMIKSRRMKWEGHVASMGEVRNANTITVGKHEWEDTTSEI
jgi:hypothetical protein